MRPLNGLNLNPNPPLDVPPLTSDKKLKEINTFEIQIVEHFFYSFFGEARMEPPRRHLAIKTMKYKENEAFEPAPCYKSNEIQRK